MIGAAVQTFQFWVAILIPVLLQTWFLAWRIGRIEQRIISVEYRVRRLESVTDRLLLKQEH